MKAGTQECDHGGSRSWRRIGDKEKMSSSFLVSDAGIQDTGATEKFASPRNGQGQAQSALKILQHQLESFQALRQQTLQNVSMVQSEISGILNKNISDMKHPEFNPDPLLLTSTPINVTKPRWCPEASLSKNRLHLDKRTTQFLETNPNKILGGPAAHGNVPCRIFSKYQSAGKAEAVALTPRKKAFSAVKNDHELNNSASSLFSPAWVGLEAEARTALGENKGYAGPNISMAFHADEDEHVIKSVSSSFRDMKDDNEKTRHELAHPFEVQKSSTAQNGKDNDSGYLSEQDPTEKVSLSSEDFKSKRTSESEDSVDELHVATVSFKGNNQIATQSQSDTQSKNQNKDFFGKGNMFEKLQLNFSSKTGEDKSLTPEHPEERKKDKQLHLLGTKQEFPNHKVLDSCDIRVGSDSYHKKSELLQITPKESDPLPKKLMDLQSENVDLKKQMKPLTDIIQSLTEQNAKYQKQIKDLHDEKNSIQERLVKSDRDCKECIKEVKNLLKKCKELEEQKITLEEKQDQLYAQNQRMMRNMGNFQKKEQEALENLAALTQEKSDLVEALGTRESQITPLQVECEALEEKVMQLTEEKSLLEKELEEKQKQIQQLKENKEAGLSDMEAVRKMTESLQEEKLNLEKALQESTDSREVLQKELEEAQKERADTEIKLLNECKNTRLEAGVLKTSLSNMEKECDRLSVVVGSMTEDNWILKKELHEYKQEVSEHKATIRKLNERLLLMENETRTLENERDVLHFEVNRLSRNNGSLRDQVTTLFRERYKPRHSPRSKRLDRDPAHPTEIHEEMSSFQHISVKYNSPECGRIAETRRQWEEEAHYKEAWPSHIQQRYSTVSVSCTTSVIRESSLHTAVQMKFGTLCSAT
ncbi:coiled-coil domain-containing protein 110 isoform X2 [Sphaerodactylus townsendi]|uniref:coiled-coil domain-containing protein 110 isoform X2 n=1 Tax=Sphaerodactylus townsendi TaxID=933632 RepID=UPI00202710A0|nr:coiled-coil domain-containing protein 110 isoform X2 [Sphaerodactylus townsendi]